MNRNAVDPLTTALRGLDPATTTELTEAERERADATLARILTTSPDAPTREGRRRSRRRRGFVLAGLVAGGAAVPVLLFGGSSAFATWTPEPTSLVGEAAAEAADSCRAALPAPDQGVEVAAAERRGEFSYVLLTGPRFEGACVLHDDLLGTFDEAKRGSGYMGSATTDPVEPPALAADQIEETDSMQGTVSVRGRLPFTSDEGMLTWVNGYVGSDVVAVTVHPPTGPAVEASLAGGRFVAWWPSEQPSSKNLEVMEAWTYTVTLADGSTREVAG